ncbi:hypothetical protein FMEAI12_6110029 [Parafrankia sp. Ea1.12]|nr:hypothetical protein FMEAI12_6110029 [Parafrankia sp. Ea1.12]
MAGRGGRRRMARDPRRPARHLRGATGSLTGLPATAEAFAVRWAPVPLRSHRPSEGRRL